MISPRVAFGCARGGSNPQLFTHTTNRRQSKARLCMGWVARCIHIQEWQLVSISESGRTSAEKTIHQNGNAVDSRLNSYVSPPPPHVRDCFCSVRNRE